MKNVLDNEKNKDRLINYSAFFCIQLYNYTDSQH